jgi:peptide/nickel transport system substrate-binding protein
MPKSEKLFEFLRLITEYPNLRAADLAQLCDVSERGIYRYINTLERAGIPVRLIDGGYRTDADTSFSVANDSEDAGIIRTSLIGAMNDTPDPRIRRRCQAMIREIDKFYPTLKNGRQHISILPKGVKGRGGMLTIGHGSTPLLMNPLETNDSISMDIMSLVFSSLVKVDKNGAISPDIAKSWEVSEDGLLWTIYLKRDIQFHDNHPLTAKDVAFTYKSLMDSRMASRYSFIEGVTASNNVVKLKLRHPYYCLDKLDFPILPEHLDLFSGAFGRKPIGSGPYMVSEWADVITLEKNQNYYVPDRPILDRLIFKPLLDKKAALEAMTNGKIDLALNVMSNDMFALSGSSVFRIYPIRDNTFYILTLNTNKPPFDNRDNRYAICHGIDIDSLIERQLKGHGEPCTGPFPVDSWAYNTSVERRCYSPEKTRARLDGAELIMGVPAFRDAVDRLAYAIRAQLIKAGVSVKTVQEEVEGCHMLLQRLSCSTDPDSVSKYFATDGDWNVFSYSDNSIDQCFATGRRGLEQRKDAYHKIHQTLHEDCPAIFLATGREYIGSRYNLSGILDSPKRPMDSIQDWCIQSGIKVQVPTAEIPITSKA